MTLFAGAGILAAIVGFASQAAFSNIVSGIFIVIFKPFRVGDIVRVGTLNMGTIEDITLRHTVIKDFENRRLVIPNAVISSETIHNANLIEDSINNHIFFDISYDSDIDLATRIIQEEAEKHHFSGTKEQKKKSKRYPKVIVRLLEFTDSSQRLRAQVWTDDPIEGFELKCDIHRTIKKDSIVKELKYLSPTELLSIKRRRKKKAGNNTTTSEVNRMPGSLVYTGQQHLAVAKLEVIRFNEAAYEREEITLDQLDKVAKDEFVSWLNIEGLHDIEVIKALGETFKIHNLALEDILNVSQRPAIDEYDDHLFGL